MEMQVPETNTDSKNTKKRHPIRNTLLILLALVVLVIVVAVIRIRKAVESLDVQYPELTGNPAVGEWYTVTPADAKSSDGSPWHGLFRLGSENKVVIYFFGGGVSLNEQTSEQTAAKGDWFFVPNTALQDFVALGGISAAVEENPFRNWSFLVLPYGTGDFHTGTGVYQFTDQNGNDHTVYHNGYVNYVAFVEEAKKYIDAPEAILVTGFSAGGFATALLTDDVMDRFPQTENVTACVDSALLLYDGWHHASADLWQSPEVISSRLVTDNIVLDSLRALHEKRGDRVKILFTCSTRDSALQEYQSYIRGGAMMQSRENSARFQQDLAQMTRDLQKYIPQIGLYIWEYGISAETDSTQHTIISSNVYDRLEDDVRVIDWIYDATCGEISSHGLSHLD